LTEALNNSVEPAADVKPGDPYCGQCGYSLKGLEERSRCPECGRPVIDVLMRHGEHVIPGRRYRSEATLFGLPVVSVATGPAPGEKHGHARGIIAVGDRATGLLAVGGRAYGVVAVGGMAFGVCACGGIGVGLLSALGGIAVGALAWGGVALGVIVSGGLALGWLAAGGVAVGQYAFGGLPIGMHTIGLGPSDPGAVTMLERFEWFYGPAGFGDSSIRSLQRILKPTVVVGVITAVPMVIVGLLALLGVARFRGAEER
jgi:hypothetical protein